MVRVNTTCKRTRLSNALIYNIQFNIRISGREHDRYNWPTSHVLPCMAVFQQAYCIILIILEN